MSSFILKTHPYHRASVIWRLVLLVFVTISVSIGYRSIRTSRTPRDVIRAVPFNAHSRIASVVMGQSSPDHFSPVAVVRSAANVTALNENEGVDSGTTSTLLGALALAKNETQTDVQRIQNPSLSELIVDNNNLRSISPRLPPSSLPSSQLPLTAMPSLNIVVDLFDQMAARNATSSLWLSPRMIAAAGAHHAGCAFPSDEDRIPPRAMHLRNFTRLFVESYLVPELQTPTKPSGNSLRCASSLDWRSGLITHNSDPTARLDPALLELPTFEWRFSGTGEGKTTLEWITSLPSNLNRTEWAQLRRHISPVLFNASHSVGGYLVFSLQLRRKEGPVAVTKGPTYICVTHADGALITAHRFPHRIWSPKFVNHSTVAMLETAGDTRFDVLGDSYGILWNWQTGGISTTNLQAATHDVEYDPLTDSWITIQRKLQGPAYCIESGFVIHPNLTYGMECILYNKSSSNKTFPIWVDVLAEIHSNSTMLWEWNPLVLFNDSVASANPCYQPRGLPQHRRETCIRRIPIAFLPTAHDVGAATMTRMWRTPLYRGGMYAYREMHRPKSPLDVNHGNTVLLDGVRNQYIYYHCAYLNTFFKLSRTSRRLAWSAGTFVGLKCADRKGEVRESCTHHAHGLQKVGHDQHGELFVTFDNDARSLERLRDNYKRAFMIYGDLTEVPRFSRLLMFRVNTHRHYMKEVGYWLRPNAHFLTETSTYKSFNRFAGGAVQYFPFGRGNVQGSFMDYHVEYTSEGYIAAMMFVDSGGFLHSANRFFTHPIVQIEPLGISGTSPSSTSRSLRVCIYDVALMNMGRPARLDIKIMNANGIGDRSMAPANDDELLLLRMLFHRVYELQLFPRWRPTCALIHGLPGRQATNLTHPKYVVNITVTIAEATTSASAFF